MADFGGNDGYAAYSFYVAHKIKPLVVDCEPRRLERADKVFKLPTYQSFIERMPELRDKSVHWGFCSHTLEHSRDAEKATQEIARVTKYGCLFVLPLEGKRHAVRNHAHAICFTRPGDWKRLLNANGWKVKIWKKCGDHEVQMYAEPA